MSKQVTYLLQFKDDDQWLAYTDREEAARYFADWPQDYRVVALLADGKWEDQTDSFRAEWRRDENEAIALEQDVRQTYYAGCM